MNAPTPAQAAARRLQLADLPRRTHEARPYAQRPQGAKLSAATRSVVYERIVELRQQGVEREDIARIAGVSRRTVSNYLRQAGLAFRRVRAVNANF